MTVMYASGARRTGAIIVDQGVVTVLMLPVLFWYLRGLFGPQSGTYLLSYGPWLFVIWFIISLLYHGIGWASVRGTVGCHCLHIAVRTTRQTQVLLHRTLLRFVIMGMSIGIGWIPFWFTDMHQTLHDMSANTIVIQTARMQKKVQS